VLWKHVFRNALMPIIAGFPAAFLGAFFTGSLLIETLFSLDGLGLLSYESVIRRDYPVVLGTLYLFTVLGLLTKLSQRPHVRLGGPACQVRLVSRCLPTPARRPDRRRRVATLHARPRVGARSRPPGRVGAASAKNRPGILEPAGVPQRW
jgi:hypothetical protein